MTVYDPADDADKMRSLVQLAASIGNQLANVATSLAIEADQLDWSDIRQLLTTSALIRQSARRTETIARDLLRFAGQAPVQPQTLSVARTLADIDNLLRRLAGDSVSLVIHCGDDIAAIVADVSQLEQILCTLVSRARDAMADNGAITIRAATSTSRDQVLPRIFEPVLVRKAFGLGLGLATVYGIVRQMGGHVTVGSDASGSRFSIFLPAACREDPQANLHTRTQGEVP